MKFNRLLPLLVLFSCFFACDATAQRGDGSQALSAAVGLASGEEPAAKESDDKAPPANPEDEEARYEKYWDEINFDWDQFDEVLDLVASEYIEKDVDQRRAFVTAAAFALASLEPAYDLVPESYYLAHKDDADLRFEAKDRDENIRLRRAEARKTQDEMQAAWAKIDFGRPDLERVVAFVEKKAVAMKKTAKDKVKIPTHAKILISAAQGYLYSLDPHSSLVSQRAWDESTEKTHDASFDGIGAVLTQRWEPGNSVKNRLRGKSLKIKPTDGFTLVELAKEDEMVQKTFVESPMQGQPAAIAGLWAGDEILAVDGKPVEGMPLTKVVSMIRGPRGTQVKLTVQRPGELETREIAIPRSRIKVTNVEGRLLEHHPGIAFIKLTGFIETSYGELVDELKRLDSEVEGGLRGLVFDLRLNSGGLLQQAVEISDLFLAKGNIVTVKNRKSGLMAMLGSDEVYKAHEKGTIGLPMVVLTDDGSASASEIVASAIQDNGRGIVVGERTFGKASVQTLISPRKGEGYYVKLTIARYYGPSGRTIQVVGVQPDVDVAPTRDGKAPVGFREEDLSNHLPPIAAEYTSPATALLPQLSDCVKQMGIADSIAKANPNPQVKFDYQLFVGADWLECLVRHSEGRLE
jgi:C-terminal peptidase prc